MPSFVLVVSVKSAQVNKETHERRPACIEIVMGIIKVRVPGGANPRLARIGDSQDHPLRPQALGRPHPLPRRWPHRARHQHRRASMRPQALTRKNALFAGHDDGAENWAIVASLIEACKLNDVEPQAYLADVLVRLVNLWPNNRLDELLPWTWAAARQQQQRAAA
jgi:hypothetical protein